MTGVENSYLHLVLRDAPLRESIDPHPLLCPTLTLLLCSALSRSSLDSPEASRRPFTLLALPPHPLLWSGRLRFPSSRGLGNVSRVIFMLCVCLDFPSCALFMHS